MGQLRNAVRAYLLEGYGPAQTLGPRQPPARHARRRLRDARLPVRRHRARGAIRYANAGHPPPLVVGPDGATRWLEDGLAPPIGAAQRGRLPRGRGPDPRRRRARPLHRRARRAPPRADRHRPRTARRGRGGQPGPCRHAGRPARRRDARQRAARRRRGARALAPRGRRRAARRAPARRARPRSARCASGCGTGWTAEGLAGAEAGDVLLAVGRGGLQRDRAPDRAGARRVRRHARRAWRGTPCGSRSATTAAGTTQPSAPHRGRGMQIMQAVAGDVAIERTPGGTTVTIHHRRGDRAA